MEEQSRCTAPLLVERMLSTWADVHADASQRPVLRDTTLIYPLVRYDYPCIAMYDCECKVGVNDRSRLFVHLYSTLVLLYVRGLPCLYSLIRFLSTVYTNITGQACTLRVSGWPVPTGVQDFKNCSTPYSYNWSSVSQMQCYVTVTVWSTHQSVQSDLGGF